MTADAKANQYFNGFLATIPPMPTTLVSSTHILARMPFNPSHGQLTLPLKQ